MVVKVFSSSTCHDRADPVTGWTWPSTSAFDAPSGIATQVADCPSVIWVAPEPDSGTMPKCSGSEEVSSVTALDAVNVTWGDPWASVTRPTGPSTPRASTTTVAVS